MPARTPAAALLLAAALTVPPLSPIPPAALAATAPVDPALSQTVTADESVAAPGTPATIVAGHVDLGPLPNAEGPDADAAGEFALLARDDTAVPPVWRHTDDVVLRVGDAAAQTLPEGDQFDFTGASAGDTVWVVPQTEVPGVPWLGWNTQSPDLIAAADRGVTFEFAGHNGPGQFSLFLQNGGFEPPQLLWSSAAEGTQPFFVELNTHTHANWVFTQPGIHQVALRVKIPLLDGTETATTRVVTFAVGDATDDATAQAASWQGEFRMAEAGTGTGTGTASSHGSDSQAMDSNTWWLLGAGVLVCAVIGAAGIASTRKGGRR